MTGYYAVYLPLDKASPHVFAHLEDVIPLLPAADVRSEALERPAYHVLIVNPFSKSRCEIAWYRSAFHPPENQVNGLQPFGVEPKHMGVVCPDDISEHEIPDKEFRGLVSLLFSKAAPNVDPTRTFWGGIKHNAFE